MIEAAIILAILLVIVLIVQRDVSSKVNVHYQVAFSIRDHQMVGGGTYTNSYNQNIDFDDIVDIYTKHLNEVLRKEPGTYSLGQEEEITDLEMLDQDLAKYWVKVSIKNLDNPENTYYIVYYSNAERDFNVDIRNALGEAAKEVRQLQSSYLRRDTYSYVSDDDD